MEGTCCRSRQTCEDQSEKKWAKQLPFVCLSELPSKRGVRSRQLMTAYGTKRRIFAARRFSRYQSEADRQSNAPDRKKFLSAKTPPPARPQKKRTRIEGGHPHAALHRAASKDARGSTRPQSR